VEDGLHHGAPPPAQSSPVTALFLYCSRGASLVPLGAAGGILPSSVMAPSWPPRPGLTRSLTLDFCYFGAEELFSLRSSDAN
jgi:hypothetical protein